MKVGFLEVLVAYCFVSLCIVRVGFGGRSVVFFARLQKGGRITVPRVEAEVLAVKAGSVLKAGLLAEKTNKNSQFGSS
ncbi:MAG: hypothetical protein OEX76_01710 [Candidatus Bathyarchaeota archaeon]|nr:hypothetical protein [Candidatus Bathyarchaeota archaeon]MDH5532051.1 hypothetical protein [Candidatus Bathyarchaeota archaeon]